MVRVRCWFWTLRLSVVVLIVVRRCTGKKVRCTGEKVFAPSVGYYSRLCDVPGERYLMYREKGVGTREKVFEVPGKRYLLFQMATIRVYTMYRGKGIWRTG